MAAGVKMQPSPAVSWLALARPGALTLLPTDLMPNMGQQYEIELIVAVLGLSPAGECHSKLWLSERIQDGLPAASLVRVYEDVLGGNPAHLRHLASSSTLSRARNENRPLSPLVSEKLVRLAHVWIQLQRTYKDVCLARRFLTEPHMLLGRRSPLAVAVSNRVGVEAVEQLIGRLRAGSAL